MTAKNTKANDMTATETTRIGRFTAIARHTELCDEPVVEFAGDDGRVFGDIRLSTAKNPVVVDLYESAMWRLCLPLHFDVTDYCLTDEEMAELKEWANGIEI